MFTKTLITGIAVSIMTTLATASFAGTCKNITLKAENLTGSQIVIVGMGYRTYDDHGIEIGGQQQSIANLPVAADNFFSVQRNLKGAKNASTRLFVEYRVRKKINGWNQWSAIKRQTTWAFDCFSGSNIELMLLKL